MYIKFLLIVFLFISANAKTIHRTIGGELIPNDNKEQPWLVEFRHGRVVCTASLISDRFALTAHHCAVIAKIGAMTLKARGSDVISKTKNVYFPTIANATGTKEMNAMAMDLAVIEIDQPIVLQTYINLPQANTIEKYYDTTDSAILFGYGVNDILDEDESYKQFKNNKVQPTKLSLSIMDRETCNAKLLEDGKLYSDNVRKDDNEVIKRLICTDNIKDAKRRNKNVGMCAGDSGGPLVVLKNNKYIQIGIVSGYLEDGSDQGCGYNTGRYANVSFHAPWIKSVLEKKISPSTYKVPHKADEEEDTSDMEIFYRWAQNIPKKEWHVLGLGIGAILGTDGSKIDIEGHELDLGRLKSSFKKYNLYLLREKKWIKYNETSQNKIIKLKAFEGMWFYIGE